MSPQPPAVTRAIWLHWVLVVLGLAATVLVVVLHDDLVEAWARGNRNAREVLEQGGVEAVEREFAVPAFIPLAIVFFILMASLIWVLLAFFRNRYNWARLSLAALHVFLAISVVAGILTGPPAVFVVLGVIGLVIQAAAAFFLWHPETREHVHRVSTPL